MRDKEGTVQPRGIGQMHEGLGYELLRGEQRLLEADATDVGEREFKNFFLLVSSRAHANTSCDR